MPASISAAAERAYSPIFVPIQALHLSTDVATTAKETEPSLNWQFHSNETARETIKPVMLANSGAIAQQLLRLLKDTGLAHVSMSMQF